MPPPGRKATSFNPVLLEIPGIAGYNPPNYMFLVGILYGIMGALLAVYYVGCQLMVKVAFRPLKKAAKRIVGGTGWTGGGGGRRRYIVWCHRMGVAADNG